MKKIFSILTLSMGVMALASSSQAAPKAKAKGSAGDMSKPNCPPHVTATCKIKEGAAGRGGTKCGDGKFVKEFPDGDDMWMMCDPAPVAATASSATAGTPSKKKK